MRVIKKFDGNNKESKITIYGNETFDFTLYKTHIVIDSDNIEVFNNYAETLVFQQVQKSVVEIPVFGKNILVKIESDYDLSLIDVIIKEA